MAGSRTGSGSCSSPGSGSSPRSRPCSSTCACPGAVSICMCSVRSTAVVCTTGVGGRVVVYVAMEQRFVGLTLHQGACDSVERHVDEGDDQQASHSA